MSENQAAGLIYYEGGPLDGKVLEVPFGVFGGSFVPVPESKPLRYAEYEETFETNDDGVAILRYVRELDALELPGLTPPAI
jgi:hypothetical protein